MSNDLAEILESIRTTQANILARLNQIEQAQELAGSTELVVPGRWGYTSPTSPPSQRVSIRGGQAAGYRESSSTLYMFTWRDFQPDLSISAFADAYYYRAVIPWVDLDWYSPYDGFDVWEDDTDFETYEESAQHLSIRMVTNAVYIGGAGQSAFPFCAIVIRNDGTTGAINRFLPVTLADRQQSSFLMRDLRPWFFCERSS